KNTLNAFITIVFLYEWKHFVRNPFKVVALFLFIVAGVYALYNGANLYNKQVTEIEGITAKLVDQKQETIAFYDNGEKGPKGRPWVDVSTPFWATWYLPVYHYKKPSPALVYSIGQAEQYGFYKRITFQSSPYDADMAEEIANPERLQSGTLDFSFVLLYLMPLLLLIWLYNIKGAEADGNFLSLINVQATSPNTWLFSRVAFYLTLMTAVIFGLMVFGGVLTNVFNEASTTFGQIFMLLLLYIMIWGVAYAFILYTGKSSIGNTLKMVGLWLLFAFISPAIVHQWVSIKHPANLMTDYIDSQRDEREKIYSLPDSAFQLHVDALFPEIVKSPVYQDKERKVLAMNRSGSAIANELKKKSIVKIENSNDAKNQLIRFSYWFNPVTFFQNKLNSLSQTHYIDYQNYRNEIQTMIDSQLRLMVLDTWNDVKVDKKRYLEYEEALTQKN
ncbi:MAG: hypothetical protein AAFO07_33920, partial [Bacteroidota bacterium]